MSSAARSVCKLYVCEPACAFWAHGQTHLAIETVVELVSWLVWVELALADAVQPCP